MKQSLITFGLFVIAGSGMMNATTITYSDRATWTSAVTVLSNFDSGSGTTVGGYTAFNTSAGLIVTDLQIIGYNNAGYDLTRNNASATQPWFDWGTGAILRTGDKTATNTVYARINFTTPVSAFGFDFGSPGGSRSVTVDPDGLSSSTVNTLLKSSGFTFWGVASDTQTFSFVNIYLNTANDHLALDNISRGSYAAAEPPPAETAEPGTLLLFTMGASLIAFARYKSGAQQEPIV